MAAAPGPSAPTSPRAGVIRVLVGALADDSVDVREAATLALQNNAQWNSITILDCCMASLRTVRRRTGQLISHHARVFRVMAYTVRVLDEQELDVGLLRKISKLALMEMTSNKEVNIVWQKAASGLIVAIGTRLPDLMMDEIFLQLTGTIVSASAVVQSLAEFASLEASKFTPRVKGVFSRVLPLLGCIKDGQRAIFANAFKEWCWAISQYYDDDPSAPPLDNDTIAFLHSAFELFLESWVASREPKTRLATVEALGEMVPHVREQQLKAALPRLLPVILTMYKKEKEDPLPVTRSLRNLLHAVLKPREKSHGTIMLLDFQGLWVVVNTILPMATIHVKLKEIGASNIILRNCNEVLQCFLTIGYTFNDELFTLLISRIITKEDTACLGAISVVQHLLPWLHESWESRKSQLIDTIKRFLYEQDLNFCKALVELIVAMASCGWINESCGEVFVEFLVKQCAVREVAGKSKIEVSASKKTQYLQALQPNESFKTELKMGVVSPSELRAMCDKAMLLLSGTMPEMEVVLWPYLLKLVIVKEYTGAIPTICKSISDIARRKLANGLSMEIPLSMLQGTPKPEEILARMLILLQNPFGSDQQAFHVLTVLYFLGDLFPKSVALLWEDEIPKLKAYINDPEDLKVETWQQGTWDDMIMHLLAESLDVIQSTEWTLSLGNALADQYSLYVGDHAHTALLHRCLGILLERVDNRFYVREKLEIMYRNAVLSDVSNRVGLAMGYGLAAAAHLDTVLEKLKKILESQSQNKFQRFIFMIMDPKSNTKVDDVYAALALMYGYAASYAPSNVIEARIDAIVGTNMLSGLLDVRTATAKQAVITSIELLGQSVKKASAHAARFPLKRRDQLLSYTLTLMAARNSSVDSEALSTQILALNACTTLVSVEPKLTSAMRDLVLKETLEFFALPLEPKHVIDTLMLKLTALLRSILLTSAEDGKSRADQLQYLLKSLDVYVSSSVGYQRLRACSAVLNLLTEFRALCSAGSCAMGCSAPCMHLRASTNQLQRSIGGVESTGMLLLPLRDSMNLGERLMAYIPRCTDVFPSIRKFSFQIIAMLFSIGLLLPVTVGSTSGDKHASYAALSAIEDLIVVTKWDTDADDENNTTFTQLVDRVAGLLTSQELVAALYGSVAAICDKILSSAKGALGAVAQLIGRRGHDLGESDIQRITQSLLIGASLVIEKSMRLEALNLICCLGKYTWEKLVFAELLAVAEKDITTKDVSRLRGGWTVQDAFLALAQDEVLGVPFLDYVLEILTFSPVYKETTDKSDNVELGIHTPILNQMPQAALAALTTFFRKGAASRRAIEQRYATVVCAFLVQFGSCHGVVSIDVLPLRNLIKAFQEFCDCVGDKDMKKVLAQDGEQLLAGGDWTFTISRIANCVFEQRPKQVESICDLLWPVLKRKSDVHRAVAAATLSEYMHHCKHDILLNQLVGELTAQIGDESVVVRQLCVKGLVEIPKEKMQDYVSQVLSVIIALIEDPEEHVASTVVQGLIVVLEHATQEAVGPVLLNLCGRLRTLQLRKNPIIRAAAFGAFGELTHFGFIHHDAFVEQIHSTLPRVLFHVHDESNIVQISCKATLKRFIHYLDMEKVIPLTESRIFNSDHRLDYEAFLKEFTRKLVDCHIDRVDTYISSAIQNFESEWPDIQANAALFASCFLSQLPDHKSVALYLPQVVGSLIRMTANSPSSVVRSTSANSLSVLLNSIH